ncbi:MAG TPA: hypothetical protein VEG30_09505 [Terriglobales bacterium]|nr:hypothetical protein [Terriglobales bacterium]
MAGLDPSDKLVLLLIAGEGEEVAAIGAANMITAITGSTIDFSFARILIQYIPSPSVRISAGNRISLSRI